MLSRSPAAAINLFLFLTEDEDEAHPRLDLNKRVPEQHMDMAEGLQQRIHLGLISTCRPFPHKKTGNFVSHIAYIIFLQLLIIQMLVLCVYRCKDRWKRAFFSLQTFDDHSLWSLFLQGQPKDQHQDIQLDSGSAEVWRWSIVSTESFNWPRMV